MWFGSNSAHCRCAGTAADTVGGGMTHTTAWARRKSFSSSVAERRAPLTVLILALCTDVTLQAASATDIADPLVVQGSTTYRYTNEVGHRALFVHHFLLATGTHQKDREVLVTIEIA